MQRYDSLVHRSILMFFFLWRSIFVYDRRIYPCKIEISRKYQKINWNYLKTKVNILEFVEIGFFFGVRLRKFIDIVCKIVHLRSSLSDFCALCVAYI